MSRLGRIVPRGRRGLPPEPPRDAADGPIVPAEPEYDDPVWLAQHLGAAERPLLLAFDVDGTLAPLMPHPSLSEFEPGVAADLAALADRADVRIGIISGRSWHDLTEQFRLPASIVVVGSHGLERGSPGTELDDDDRRRVARLAMLAGSAAATAPGAWVEHKPAGIALHVRQASAADAANAVRSFLDRIEPLGPLEILPGDEVVEVGLRRYDKGAALEWLRDACGANSVVFVGDDVTDEDAFAVLRPTDLGIKVGRAETIATRRLADPADVASFVAALAAAANDA